MKRKRSLKVVDDDGPANSSPRMAVIRAIKDWIADGSLIPGEALPSERDLSTRLHVQRPTIRRALQILETEGIVRTVSPKTRVVTQNRRLMEHSIVVISPPVRPKELVEKREPGWSFMMFEAINRGVVAAGYNLLVIHTDRVTPEHLDRVISGRPSGVIIPEVQDESERYHWIEAIHAAGIHVVTFGDGDQLQAFDRVVSDHEAGSYMLTRLLIKRGCKRPLMLFTPGNSHYWVRQRRAGYERAMSEAGLETLPLIVCGPTSAPPNVEPDTPQAFDAIRRHYAGYLMDYIGPLAKNKPIDAILAASDGDTFGIAGACRMLGAQPGKDVLIVGYDNYWRECHEMDCEPSIPIATIDQHNPRIGAELVQLLIDRESGSLPPGVVVRRVQPDLIQTDRSSSTTPDR
jgi:DNA-binding LacI/PurR family transcriptional regulator